MTLKHKNVLNSVLVLSLTAQAIPALAQTNPVAVIGARGGTGAVLGQPGTYEVRSYNQAELEKMLVTHFGKRQDQDAQFVEKSVADITAKLNALNADLVREGGILAVHRITGASGTSPIKLEVYLGLTQDFKAKVAQARTAIRGLLLIPSAIKSQTSVTIDNVERIQLPARMKVDLEKVQAWYESELMAVTGPLAQLGFLLMLPNGTPQLVRGIDFVPQGLQIPASQIQAMQDAVERDMMQVNGELSQKIQDINIVTLEQLRSSIRAFGTSQTYRFQLNKDGRDRNLAALYEIFWARDYLRALFGNGAKLGAIGVDYTKQKAHWDFFASSNRMQFIDQWITAPGRLTEMQDSLAVALKTQESRSKEVFGDGVDMLSRIMSGVTFVRGQSQLASVNTVILTLLKRDIEHEIELQYAGATQKMQSIYQKTYYGAENSAQEKATFAREDNYTNATSASPTSSSADLMITMGSSCDFLCAFRRSEMSLKLLVDRSQQARAALRGIEELRKLSGASQIIDDRRNGLRRR